MSQRSGDSQPVVQRPVGLLRRLHKDIDEIARDPYPGVEIFAHDDSYNKLCLILTPQKGSAFAGLRLHFNVELPSNWPQSPPIVSCSHGIKHPNIFMGTYLSDGKTAYICCDLLKEASYDHERSDYNGGYTPAFTLKALSLQLLSFFSSRLVDQEGGGYSINIGDEILTCIMNDQEVMDYPQILKEKLKNIEYNFDWYYSDAPQSTALTEALEGNSKKLIRQYKSFALSESQDMVKAGQWQGWGDGSHLQLEAECVRLPVKNGDVRVRYRNPRWCDAYGKLRTWKCATCKYNEDGKSFVDGSIVKSLKRTLAELDGRAWDPNEPVKSDQDILQSKTQHLEMLHNEILLEIAEHLSVENIHNFSSAYPRFAELIQNNHTIENREIQCFFLRTQLNSPSAWPRCSRTIIGMGVKSTGKDLESAFDLLSIEAFEVYGIRKGVDRTNDFTHFLPLAFSQPHFERMSPFIWQYLKQIYIGLESTRRKYSPNFRGPHTSSAGLPAVFPKHEVLTVIYKLMNKTIVQLMSAADEAQDTSSSGDSKLLKASEKCVTAYSQLFYLLICLIRADPNLRRKAYDNIQYFCKSSNNRSKDKFPDLGELIIQICMVNATTDPTHAEPHMRKSFSWPNELVGPFLEETFTRNVRWILQKHPELAVLEQGDNIYRRKQTFLSSLVSIRLVMFQTYFLRFFVGNIQKYPGSLEQHYGSPPPGVPEMVMHEIKRIYLVRQWGDYFRKVGHLKGMNWDNGKLCQMLRGRVKEASRRGRAYWEMRYSNRELYQKRYKEDPAFDERGSQCV